MKGPPRELACQWRPLFFQLTVREPARTASEWKQTVSTRDQADQGTVSPLKLTRDPDEPVRETASCIASIDCRRL